MNTNQTAILNGDQIYLEELIRENARLTIRHEADKQMLVDYKETLARRNAEIEALLKSADEQKHVKEAMDRAQYVAAKLAKAEKTIHHLLRGGDPCKVCARDCKMGSGCHDPIWKEDAVV